MVLKAIITLALLALASSKVHFNGDKVYSITPKDESELKFIHTWISKNDDRIDVWKEPSQLGLDVDIHVFASHVDAVKKEFEKAGLTFKVKIEDLEKAVEEEANSNVNYGFAGTYNYDNYNRYGDIMAELGRLNRVHSRNTEMFNVGVSSQRRRIVGIKVTDGSRRRKPAIWIDGGIHAREWISPATVMYTLKQLLSPDPKFHMKVQNALNKYDFYVLPVFNVDGYEFTHTGNRMWRKTRSGCSSWGGNCCGADPNRNWDSKFGGAGTSSSVCQDIYHGKYAFSEPETRAVSNKLKSIKQSQGLKSYWNVHAYSQFLLYPWSYTSREAPDAKEMNRVATIFKKGVKYETGKDFVIGQPSRILYAVAGGSIDWTYEKLGVIYSYAPELRPTQRDGNGFLLEAHYIKYSGREFTNGFLDAVAEMR